MLPASTIVLAALRWITLLRVCTIDQASIALRSDAAYTDLTRTQYLLGFDLLKHLSFLSGTQMGNVRIASAIQDLPDDAVCQLLFERVLERSAPAWLQDADVLITTPDDIPQDADCLGQALNMKSEAAFLAIMNARAKVDSAERARVGMAGERALIDLLEGQWPGSTFHASQVSDGFGYDVGFQHKGVNWHLEVKATTRKGRLAIHLTRHEQEVGQLDRNWRLVVVGLNGETQLEALATVNHLALWCRAPRDSSPDSRWDSAVHEVPSSDLRGGLAFITGARDVSRHHNPLIYAGYRKRPV